MKNGTMNGTIKDMMSSGPVTLAANESLVDAAKKMRECDIGPVMVLSDDGSLHGIITDRDIVVRAIAEQRDPANTTVGEIASPAPTTVSPEEGIDQAIDLMREHKIRRLPVVKEGKPVGMLSLGDLAEERDRRSVLGEISAAEPTR